MLVQPFAPHSSLTNTQASLATYEYCLTNFRSAFDGVLARLCHQVDEARTCDRAPNRPAWASDNTNLGTQHFTVKVLFSSGNKT